jgi:predicted aldo/keto reductase-like oxidoreductase
MKYRRLTLEELHEMEKEFIDFLVINGITADEWVKIKRESNEKTDRMIELFSDVVLEGAMRKARFADHISSGCVFCFQFNKKEIVLTGMEDTSQTLDFTQVRTYELLKKHVPIGVKIFQQTKSYQKDREAEIFDLLQNGAQLSDGSLFKQLSLLYVTSNPS